MSDSSNETFEFPDAKQALDELKPALEALHKREVRVADRPRREYR